MNGIIFHGNVAQIGCCAEFLFEPEVTAKPTQAIAVFTTGQKAYAEIVRDCNSEIRIHVGEYSSGEGNMISNTYWQLFYNSKKDIWHITKSLETIF